MSYLERLREARYRSPSGVEFAFEFRDLQRSGSKKAAVHEFPGADLPEVQDLGQAAVRFAIEATFSGADYDLSADAFWQALAERGPATLLHPRWGDLRVLPMSIAQAEGFADGMRRATFTVEFVRLGDLALPSTAGQAEAEIAAALEETGAEGIAAEPEGAAQAAAVKKSFLDAVAEFAGKIAAAIALSGEISEEFNAAVREFENTIDALVANPQTLTDNFLALLRIPTKAAVSISAKADGYASALGVRAEAGTEAGASDAEAAGQVLQFLGLLLGLSESTLSGALSTRAEAVAIAELLQEAAVTAMTAIEEVEVASGTYVAPAEVLAAIRAIMARTAGMLLERSFSLKIERRLELDAERTPLDLCYELYGEIDSLDDFIAHNDFAGDELLLIPRGREVVYYVG